MADRLFSRINIKRRAFSWRPARSSMVMGLASPRRVRSAAIAGGRDLSLSAACARVGKATLTPAAREPVCRKRRREIMKARRMDDALCRAADEIAGGFGFWKTLYRSLNPPPPPPAPTYDKIIVCRDTENS